ncbi:hypothetical protein B0J18DRAFT_468216 [Chaetomium sp. MPI-SDFR-AT-0129]|nr:hypothetical protein B0J18DRAFT_468216 [Chaetomium sp. MPI-SDFR-AT-0129]
MGWNISQWLAFARAIQMLGALIAVGSFGYVTVRLNNTTHGVSKQTMVLEMLACFLLGYSILSIVLQHTGRRSKKTRWLTFTVVFDVFLSTILLGIINVLARGGLPMHCAGMTRPDLDPTIVPLPGFTTIGFSDEGPGRRGELDDLCQYVTPYYAVANFLIFTYIFTITATVLRILESKYTKNTKVNEMLDSLERSGDVSMKIMEPPSPLEELPRPNFAPPPSEGIMTRTASLRSTFTAATSVAPTHTGGSGVSVIPRRPIGGSAPPALPRRPIPPPASPSSSRTAANPGTGFVPVPLDDDDSAEAALVSDGMRHQPPPQLQNQHQRIPSRDYHAPFPRMPMLTEEDQSADAALVSDGMQPGDHTLPPYHPGNRRMSGHGGDNDTRLSGYVKGQTRAQNMKDSGGY